MASRGRPYTGPIITQTSSQGEIQLSDRQMQLLEARRRAKETGIQSSQQLKSSNYNGGAKRDPTPRMNNNPHSWSDEQTVPTTWSDSSSSANSAVSKSHSAASASMSQASARSRANPAKQFYGQGLSGDSKRLYDDSGESYHGSRSEAASTSSRSNEQSSQEEPVMMPRRVNRPKKGKGKGTDPTSRAAGGDQQKALLRKMMKSYTSKPSKSKDDSSVEFTVDEEPKKTNWIKSKAASSTSSGSSSASHDRAIMRKVLQRARNKKLALSNPRKQGLLKQSSSRMKKLVSPKNERSSPRKKSIGSPRSDASSRSGSTQPSKKFGFGKVLKKKSSRSPRFSSRNAKARLHNKPDSILPVDQSKGEGDSPRKSLDKNLQDSETYSHSSAAPKMLFDDSGESVPRNEAQSAGALVNANSADLSVHSKPENIDIKRQTTEVSVLSGRHSHDSADSGRLVQSRSAIDSIPEVTAEDEIEIKLSKSAGSETSAMFPSQQGETMYDDTAYDAPEIFNPEPEGYRDFIHTLKAEVAGSHTQLWESFHSVFKGNRRTRPLQQGNGSKAFDDKTKLAVASMSTYLKNEYGAESEAGTQLANDKAVKSSTSFGQHVLNRTGVARYGALCVAPTVDEEPTTSNFDDALAQNVQASLGEKSAQALMMTDSESEVSSYAASSDAATSYVESDYISEAGSMLSSTYSRGLPKVSVASQGSAALSNPSHEVKKEARISPKSVPAKTASNSKPPATSSSTQEEAPKSVPQIPQGNRAQMSPRDVPITGAAKTTPRNSIETKKLSPKSDTSCSLKTESKTMPSWKAQALANAKKAKSDPPMESEPDSSALWVGVKLRSVTPSTSGNDALKQSPMGTALPPAMRKVAATPASSTASSIPSSWSKVKLRKVVAKAEDSKKSTGTEVSKSTEVQNNDNFHHFVVRKPKTPPARAIEEKTNAEAVPRKEPSPTKKPEKPSTPSDKPAVVETTNSEDLDTKEIAPSASTDLSTHGTVSVPLAPGPESKSFFGLKVVVGEKGIMKIDCPPNQPKPIVIWHLEVTDLKSAMLDMSGYKVKLLQTNGEHKDLSFESSEHCMKFANAFHEVANGGDDESDDEDSVAESDGSVFVEQLSEEEQKVLEEFRKKKRLSSDSTQFKPAEAPTEDSNAPAAPPKPAKPATGGMSFLDQIKAKSTDESDASGDKQETTPTEEPANKLTSEEQKIVDSYKKMLKLRLPMEAVKHKMEKDQVDPNLMCIVLGENESSSSNSSTNQPPSNGLTVAEQAVAKTYERMLKMMVPAEAVQHKMEKDGIDPKIILAVLGGGEEKSIPASATSKPASQQLSEKDEATAAPYRKMLKLMMPKEAVEHKLRKDGVAPHIMASVLGVDVSTFGGGKKAAAKLTDEEESIASSFRKMLTLKISKDTIRRKMQTEGISEKIMVAVLGESFIKGATRGQKTPQRRMKGGFHWSPLTSGDSLRKSIWNKTALTEYAESDVASDISKHLELFQKKEDSSAATKKIVKKDGTETKTMAKLIDLTRANNVAITLKAFNDVSQQELAKIIEFVDPHGKITGDRALFMRDLLPAPAEIKVVQNYKGEDNRLVPAEIWFKQIAHIKRVEEKIQVMRTMETFKLEVLALAESFQMLIDVCNQIMNSEKLPDILEMVRQIGNRMNAGRGEEAAGFKLDFLSRLSQTKGSDKKTTALDLVVMIFLTRNQRSALRLISDFPKCQEASKLQISELNADVRRLGGALEKCKKEKELMRKDGNIPKWGKLPSNDAKSQSSDWFANRSNFLSSVIGAGESTEGQRPETKTETVTNPSPADMKIESQDGDTGDNGYNMVSAVNKIDDFLTQATSGFDQLKQVNQEAIKTCKELLDFFCEKGGEMAASNLLAVLATFAENLEQAVKKQEEQEKRREARLKNARSKKVQTSTTSPKQGQQHARSPTNSVVSNTSVISNVSGASEDSIGGKSLILMVNQMLKMVGDKAKEDYAKGISYDNPDSRLKQIYEKESRRDIVGKIESRRQTSEHAAQTGLSELVKKIESRSARKAAKMEDATALVRKIRHSAESDSSRTSRESIGSVSSYESRDDAGGLRSSVANRWTQKIDEDQVSDSGGSATLSSFSATSSEMRMQSRQRQQVINRWSSKHDIVEASSKDLEEESDIGFNNTAISKTRQRYLDRWASKQREEQE
mmetsp:Transcript_31368/g.75591  ORF Transcript_31368/g.75591 Transcript_31368/m.75591 type:complete len:2165 (-) Transcript_31368:45-6539(-)